MNKEEVKEIFNDGGIDHLIWDCNGIDNGDIDKLAVKIMELTEEYTEMVYGWINE